MVEGNDIFELKALISSLLVEIEGLKGRVRELEMENADLRNQLSQNSTNSHKPPSSDGYKKPVIKPGLPKEAGKKAGGQAGHVGKTLQLVDYPDSIHTHQATQCHQCGLALQGSGQIVARRQVFDLPQPRLWIEEHQVLSHQCSCGCVQTGSFPPEVSAPVQYGPRIHAQSILLNVDYRIPFAKVSQLWADLTGYAYNPATLISTQTALDERLVPIQEHIKTQLTKAQVCHFDETGVRVGGKLQWLHVASNQDYTHLFVHNHRGQQALLSDQSVFGQCHNWTVHDCWASYFAAGKGHHSLCGAHLLRELAALIEQGSIWAKDMHGYLLQAYKATRHQPIALNQQHQWRSRYQQLCQQADAEELPGLVFFKPDARTTRPKRSKARNLLERLMTHREAVMAFAFHQEVPFSNNQAERDLRPIKVKQRVSGGFRTQCGADVYARIAGFVSTMRKNRLNLVEQLANVLTDTFVWAT